MEKIIFMLSLTYISLTAFSQQYTCDGNRYKNYTFGNIDSTMNVLYGQNTTMNGVVKNLYLDVFEPSLDTASKRPLIIFIHGGGFMVGNRNDIKPLCLDFSLRGYVTATIDYRLMDVLVNDSTTVTEGMIMALSDAKASIRYFVEDAATTNLYKIDTNNIFIGGISAGAITALHAAYLNPSDNIPTYITNLINANGGFTGNSSNNTSFSTPIKAVINYSGALWRKDWISTGEPSLYSAHDSYDTIVPCNYDLSKAYPTPFPIYLYGSCVLNPVATSNGLYNQIHTFNSNGHASYMYDPTNYGIVVQETADFLYNILCNSTTLNIRRNSSKSSINVKLYPSPASNYIILETVSLKFPQNFVLNDFLGRTLISTPIYSKKTTINIENIPNGIYIYSVSIGNLILSDKIVINK